MISRIAIALAATLVLAGASYASENGHNWDGAYIGAGVGMGWASEHIETHTANINGISLNPGGTDQAFGSLFAGYRMQRGDFIFGAEAEVFLGNEMTFGAPSSCNAAVTSPCAQSGIRGSLDPIARIRGVIGTEIEPGTLIYGALGIALAEAYYTGTYAVASVPGAYAYAAAGNTPSSEDLLGLSLGIGLERIVNDRWSIRASMDYDMFRDFKVSNTGSGAGAGNGVDTAWATAAARNTIDLSRFSLQFSIIHRF